jgi:hypothetical protein
MIRFSYRLLFFRYLLGRRLDGLRNLSRCFAVDKRKVSSFYKESNPDSLVV